MQTKPAPVTLHWGIWCRRVCKSKTVPERVWFLGVDNAISRSAGVSPLHPSTHISVALLSYDSRLNLIRPDGRKKFGRVLHQPRLQISSQVQSVSQSVNNSRLSLWSISFAASDYTLHKLEDTYTHRICKDSLEIEPLCSHHQWYDSSSISSSSSPSMSLSLSSQVHLVVRFSNIWPSQLAVCSLLGHEGSEFKILKFVSLCIYWRCKETFYLYSKAIIQVAACSLPVHC